MPRDLFHRVAKRGAGLESALSNLSQSLTINGVTKTPSLLYYGANTTVSLATLDVGDNCAITGAGTDPVVDLETPLLSTSDKAVRFGAGSKYYEAPDNNNLSLGLDDFVVEAVLQNQVGTGVVFGKRLSSPFGYVEFQSLEEVFRFYVSNGGAGTKAMSTGIAGSAAAWAHAIFFCDRSGSGWGYLNTAPPSAALDMTAYSAQTIDIAAPLQIGSRAGTIDSEEGVAYFSVWQGLNWLDTHDQQAIVTARFKALCGANTDETRDSLAYLHKPVSGSKKYFLVGKNWMRLSQDVGGTPAYQKEAAATNTCDNSWDVTGSGWGVLEGSLAIGTTVAPDGTLAGAFSENGTSNPHRVQITGMNASTVETNVLSFFVKKENRGLIVAWLSAGTTSSHAYFDLDAVTTHNNDGGLTWSIVDVGDDWRKISVPFSSSASNITAYLYSSGTTGPWSGGISVAGGSNEAYSVWGLQCEVGTVPSSPIKTTAGQATRLADA